MDDDQTFGEFEAEFLKWQQEVTTGLRVYEALCRIYEGRFAGKNKLISCGMQSSADLNWLDSRRWDVFDLAPGHNAQERVSEYVDLGGFADQSIAVIFSRGLLSFERRYIHKFMREAQRILIDGGIIVVETEGAFFNQPTSEYHEDADNLAFMNFVLDRVGFLSRQVLRLKRYSLSPKDSQSDGDSSLCISVVCQKSGSNTQPDLIEAVREAMRQVLTSPPALIEGLRVGAPDNSGVRVADVPDVQMFLQAYRRWESDAKTSEEAVAALSETALGASDMARRLLKAETRILDLRKSTSIFLPLTYPWSRLATGVLGLISKRKARRLQKRLNKKKLLNSVPVTDNNTHSGGPIETIGIGRLETIGSRPKILVVKLDHIGDLFLSISAIQVLKNAWPEGHFSLVCSPTNAGLARGSALFDEVLEYKFSSELSQDVRKVKENQYAAIQAVVDQSYDLALDLRHDPDTRPHLAFINARIKAGFQSHGKHFTPLDISLPQMPQQAGLHSSTHNIHRLLLLAHHVVDVLQPVPFAQAAEALISAGSKERPIPPGDYIVLAPGGGTLAKKWSPQNFADLAGLVAEKHGVNIVILGGPAELEYSTAIAETVPEHQLFDLIGKLPLTDMAAITSKAVAFVGSDTGATHLAAMLNVPTVSIFSGVADINVWKPVGEQVSVVRAKIACAPCQIAKLEQCVADHACMTMIDVKTVYDELCRRARFQRKQN